MLNEKQRKELLKYLVEDVLATVDIDSKSSKHSWQQDFSLTEIREGDLYLCLEHRRVTVREQEVDLTVKEFDILALLIRNPKRVFTYEVIIELVWEEEYASFSRKAVNNHVSNLRQKLKVSPDVPDYIKSVYGVGYKFDLD